MAPPREGAHTRGRKAVSLAIRRTYQHPGAARNTLYMSIYRRWKRIHEWLWPAACPLCHEPIAPAQPFCDACERSLPRLDACCGRCAAPLASANAQLTCADCQQRTPAYQATHALFRYAAPIDRLIQGAKYNGRLDWAALLGRRLAEHAAMRTASVDALVPVPLHRSRLRERGYNQSHELARPLMQRLKLPLLHGVERVRATPPQTPLAREQRAHNVRGAFATERDLGGLRLAIVDDVMTSGATADALAHCLRQAGAVSVEVWVVARA